MYIYKFIVTNEVDDEIIYGGVLARIKETTMAITNNPKEYLHFIFKNNQFLPLYNLINDGEYSGKITYNKDEMIIHMPEFYEYVLQWFECEGGSKRCKQFIEMLNINNKYTLDEILEIIFFSIKNFDDLDSYGSSLNLYRYNIYTCEQISEQ